MNSIKDKTRKPSMPRTETKSTPFHPNCSLLTQPVQNQPLNYPLKRGPKTTLDHCTKKPKPDFAVMRFLDWENGETIQFPCYAEPEIDWKVPAKTHDADYSVGTMLLSAAVKYLSNEVLKAIGNL